MSQGSACKCPEAKKPMSGRTWAVLDRKCNYSAFNGYKYTPSDYSCIVCKSCGATWRTKASFVDQLPDFARNEDLQKDLLPVEE